MSAGSVRGITFIHHLLNGPATNKLGPGLYGMRFDLAESTLKQLQDLARSNFRTLPAEIRYL